MRSEEVLPIVGRRAALAAGGALAATLAGCGGAPAAPGAPSGPATPSAGSGGKGTVLGPAADVPVGGGVVYEKLEVVVTQPTASDFRGFSAVCTHTGCIVNKVADGTIDCPCHGSKYHLDGTVANGPAPRALGTRKVALVDGQVVLS